MVTLGFFDGVHLGHQQLLADVLTYASSTHSPALAVTLWPHPRIVLGNEPEKLRLITDLEAKIEILEKFGLDGLIVLEFSLTLAKRSGWDFLEHVIYRHLRPSAIVMGYDHRFGHKGEGDFPLLRRFAQEHGITALQGKVFTKDGVDLSSTCVRQEIERGEMELVASWLGRDFGFYGTVVSGEQVGRRLGFPTANIAPRDEWQQLPGHGVYEGYILLREGEDWQRYVAVINVGTRPTVSARNEVSVEAHILDFSGTLYGKGVKLFFSRKLRDEQPFCSLEDLQAQIAQDIETVRASVSTSKT